MYTHARNLLYWRYSLLDYVHIGKLYTTYVKCHTATDLGRTKNYSDPFGRLLALLDIILYNSYIISLLTANPFLPVNIAWPCPTKVSIFVYFSSFYLFLLFDNERFPTIVQTTSLIDIKSDWTNNGRLFVLRSIHKIPCLLY